MNGPAPRPLVGIDKDDLRELSRLSTGRGFAIIALQWLVIAAAIAAAKLSGLWLVTLAATVVIATRQHALAVLMHDAAHHLLHRNKRVNDFVGNVFVSFPLLVSTHRYRVHHLRHHRYLNTDQDPDLVYRIGPPSRAALIRQLLAGLVGLNTMRTLNAVSYFGLIGPLFRPADSESGLPRADKRLAVVFLLSAAGIIAALGIWLDVLIYWLLPMATVLTPILRLRAFAEHAGCPNTNDLDAARTVDAGIVERMLLAPCNVHYHVEHHLYPSVPLYHLPRLSQRLRRQAVFRENACLNNGYFVGRPRVVDDVALRA
jgi:fatty acid desaturase